jgi:hypothetical protein
LPITTPTATSAFLWNTVLEKTSTGHAAGLVTRFAGSPKLKKLHVRAMELLNGMQDTALGNGDDIGLHRPGSIRLIEKGNANRLIEAKQHVAMAKLYDPRGGAAHGLDTRMISPVSGLKLRL